MELVGNSAPGPCDGAAQSKEDAAAWKKYQCRLYYDKNRDVLLAKRRAAYRKKREGQPRKPTGRPKLSREPPGSCERFKTHI